MILTDDEIRKAAEFAAEQMWPESGYVGWTDEDAEFHRLFLEACIAKLTAGVGVPESKYAATGDITDMNNFTRDQLLAYGASQRLAGQQRETCTWTEQDDQDLPGVYATGCGGMFVLNEGKLQDHGFSYCPYCGNEIALAASPQEQT